MILYDTAITIYSRTPSDPPKDTNRTVSQKLNAHGDAMTSTRRQRCESPRLLAVPPSRLRRARLARRSPNNTRSSRRAAPVHWSARHENSRRDRCESITVPNRLTRAGLASRTIPYSIDPTHNTGPSRMVPFDDLLIILRGRGDAPPFRHMVLYYS